MAINVDLVADASRAIAEAGSLGDALEQVADNLDDLGKSSKSIDDQVQDSFKSMSDDAKTAAKDIDKSTSEAFREVAKTAKRSGKDVGDSVTDGTDRASDGMSELADESKSTAVEAAASFGSIEDAAGALQEVVANAFAGFGPAGMAAGIVAAAGIGLAISALEDEAEQINTNKENMLSLAQTIRDNGGALSEADYVANMEAYGYAIQDTKEWFELFQADAVSGFDEIKKIVKDTGLAAQDIFQGGFGDADEAAATLELVQNKLDALRAKKEAVYNLDGSIMDPVDEEALTSLEKAEELVLKNIDAQKDAEAVERTRRDAIAGSTEALIEDIKAQEESEAAEKDRRQYIDGTSEALARNIRLTEERSDAMKGSISSDLDYLDGVDALDKALKENGNTVADNTAKGRENQRAILDQASAIEQVAKDSLSAGDNVGDVTAKFQAQKDALINQVTPAFGGSEEAARQYIEQVLKTPPTAVTTVTLSGVDEVRRLLREIGQPMDVPLRPTYSPTYFQSVLAQMSNHEVPVMLKPRLGQGATP